MIILTLRTDSANAEIGLWDGHAPIETVRWEAGRQLSTQLLPKIESLLSQNTKSWRDLGGLVVFLGPGSFTGLRIGATVANVIAYAQTIPLVGAKGDAWVSDGTAALAQGRDDVQVAPDYGAAANISRPRS